MEFYELFYKWVPVWVRIPVLTILYLVLLTANGVYIGNTSDMSSGLGVYTEPFTVAYYAMYIGMGIGSMTNLRIRERYTAKSLVITGFLVMLAMNAVCATTKSPYLTILACLLLGAGKVAASTEIYLVWLQVWSKKLDVSRLYPFVYFIALGGIYTMTWMTSKLAFLYTWRYAYVAIMMLLFFCVILSVIFIERHPLKRRIPLYQMDWLGILLLIGLLMLLNYIIVYGKVEDWFTSDRIQLAGIGALVLLLLFIRRELHFKRPVFPLDLFKLPNFRLGLFYIFLLGIFVPATLQSGFSGGVLHYENFRNSELTLYLIPGVTVGCIFCYIWFYKGYHDQLLMFIGFSTVILYEVLMYCSYGNAFEMQGFWLPSFIKGIGLGILFIAVGIYITRGHTIKDVLTVVGIAFLFRSFLGTAVFTAAYNYLLYAQRIRHLNYLGSKTDSVTAVLGSGSANDLYQTFQTQAALAATKELTGYLIIAGVLIAFALLLKILHDGLTILGDKLTNAK
jgi:DHA2 family multidrug resistance protein